MGEIDHFIRNLDFGGDEKAVIMTFLIWHSVPRVDGLLGAIRNFAQEFEDVHDKWHAFTLEEEVVDTIEGIDLPQFFKENADKEYCHPDTYVEIIRQHIQVFQRIPEVMETTHLEILEKYRQR